MANDFSYDPMTEGARVNSPSKGRQLWMPGFHQAIIEAIKLGWLNATVETTLPATGTVNQVVYVVDTGTAAFREPANDAQLKRWDGTAWQSMLGAGGALQWAAYHSQGSIVPATVSSIGGIKIGTGLSVAVDGTASVDLAGVGGATTASVTAAVLAETNRAVAVENVKAPINNATFTGTTTLAADPTLALQAATKQYVDGKTNLVVKSDGSVPFTVPQQGQLPTGPNDLATKSYVDGIATGVQYKPTARAATAAALPANTYNNGTAGVGATLTGNANGVLTVDGLAIQINNLVLVRNEAILARCGLYKCTTEGTAGVPYVLTRDLSMDAASEYTGAVIPVGSGGTTNPNSIWQCTNNAAPTVGTTDITFIQSLSLIHI